MKQFHNWLDRLADQADLPEEAGLTQALVELAGDRRVLIERHQGVIQYGKEEICVKVRYGSVLIQGCGLELVHMTREQLIICGRIDSIRLNRRARR